MIGFFVATSKEVGERRVVIRLDTLNNNANVLVELQGFRNEGNGVAVR